MLLILWSSQVNNFLRYLVANQIDLYHKNKYGQTAFDICKKGPCQEYLEQIQVQVAEGKVLFFAYKIKVSN